jgi:RNA polymerase sigma-70 factor (sigma-E family)
LNRSQDDAFTAFVMERSAELRRIAFQLCGDWHQADDIVQTSLVKVYLNWRRIRHEDAALGYARTTLIRTFIDEKRKRSSQEEPSAWLPDVGAIDKDPASGNWLLHLLPRGQRAVLFLRFVEDLSVESTAEILGCSTGTVKSQSHDALYRLKAFLTVAENEPEEG